MKHRDTVTEFNNFKARLSSNQDIHRLQSPNKRNSSASSDRSDQSNGTPNRDTKNKRLSLLLNQIPSKPIKHKRLDNSKQLNQIYDIEEQPIGKGSYGIVYRAIDAKDRKPWAIKKIVKDSAGTTGVRLLEREVSILKRVTHKNIIHLEAVYETHDTMFLVTELCVEGELKDYLKKQENNVLAEPAARDIVRQLAEALFYLHKHGVVHRDIKLENVLVTRNTDVSPKVSRRVSLASGMPTLRSSVYDRRQSLPPVGQSNNIEIVIKLTDFGLSVVRGGAGSDNMLASFCGTPVYMAPEVIQNKDYSQTCDIWSMGIITYVILSGKYPWNIKNQNEQKLYSQIKRGLINYDPLVSSSAKSCIEQMLRVDPAKRITAGEVIIHSWLTGVEKPEPKTAVDMLKEMAEERMSISKNTD